jgi:hypothetical protein
LLLRAATDSSLEIEAEASRDRSGELGKDWNYSTAAKDLPRELDQLRFGFNARSCFL